MPTLIDRREGEHFMIGNTVVVVGLARDRHATLLVGGVVDGEPDTVESIQHVAAKLRIKVEGLSGRSRDPDRPSRVRIRKKD